MRRILQLLLAACLLAMALIARSDDTGTYKLLNYSVLLTPQSDGAVKIDYDQQWQVTGGHIPWVTIGTPNGDYSILFAGGNAKSANGADEGDWHGIQLNLDRDYQPGETFEVHLSITQRGLFSDNGGGYLLNFTPGWNDRAEIAALQIRLKSLGPVAALVASPAPSSTSDQTLCWSHTNLHPGEQVSISVSFSRSALPQGIPTPAVSTNSGEDFNSGQDYSGILIVIFIVLIGVGASMYQLRKGGGGYTGGLISRGGSHYSGTGCVSSCACACVSCACACACAGGGGAGCSRKQQHACPKCRGKELRDPAS